MIAELEAKGINQHAGEGQRHLRDVTGARVRRFTERIRMPDKRGDRGRMCVVECGRRMVVNVDDDDGEARDPE
jgi:hypothetical protein